MAAAHDRRDTEYERLRRQGDYEQLCAIHASPTTDTNCGCLVALTWFMNSPSYGIQYQVFTDGREWDARDFPSYAIQASHWEVLTAGSLATLQQSCAALPADTMPAPPVERLLLVSARQNGRWVTHRYDRVSPPDAVRLMYTVLDTRPELREMVGHTLPIRSH